MQKTRNYTARASILGKGGKFVTQTAKAKNRKQRRLARLQYRADGWDGND